MMMTTDFESDTASGWLESGIESGKIDAELVFPGVPTPTVPDAARAIGVQERQIIKSLLFHASDGYVVLVVASGATRVDRKKLAGVCGSSHLRLAPPELVLQRTGYAAGGTPPVGHATAFDVVVDRAVMEMDEVFGGGGRVDALLRIRPEEIVRVTGARVADIAE